MPRPFVTVHFAQSLDGHIDRPAALKPLELSNEAGFFAAHQARASHDAVLVGVRTVLRDDPRLLVSRAPGRNPDRVVFDPCLRMPLDSRVLSPTPNTRAIVLGCRQLADSQTLTALSRRGVLVRLLDAQADGRSFAIEDALSVLFDLGVRRLLVEGGVRVIQAFLHSRLVDCLEVEIAPRVVGLGGLSCLAEFGDSFELTDVTLAPLGSHILITGSPRFRARG